MMIILRSDKKSKSIITEKSLEKSNDIIHIIMVIQKWREQYNLLKQYGMIDILRILLFFSVSGPAVEVSLSRSAFGQQGSEDLEGLLGLNESSSLFLR